MIYFDNAATSYPKPSEVIAAANNFIKRANGNPGRGGHALAMRAAEEVYLCRKKVAGLLGAGEPERVCFTAGATAALNYVILGLIGRYDHVICSDIEHNSVRRPLLQTGAEISYFDAFADEKTVLEEIDSKIRYNTKAVICTYASNVLPLVLPISKIGALCKKRGAAFIVDAAQAAGVYGIDLRADNIDVLCIPAHKGLYGLTGCGAMIVSPDFDHAKIKPLLSGGSGVASFDPDMPEVLPERFEAGTLPTVCIAALGAGVDFVSSKGPSEILCHEMRIQRRIYDNLKDNEKIRFYRYAPGTLLLFNFEGKTCEEAARLLNGYGVCVRAGYHCAPDAHKKTATDKTGAVRISFSVFNTLKQADRFSDIAEHISRL